MRFPALRSLLSAIIAAGACAACVQVSSQSRAESRGDVRPHRAISGEGAFAASEAPLDSVSSKGVYVDAGTRFEIYRDAQAPHWTRPLWVSRSEFASAPAALAFEACAGPVLRTGGEDRCPDRAGTPVRNGADRIELALENWRSGPDRDELKLDRRRYVAFSMMVHPGTQAPAAWTIVHQVWQRVDRTKASPPFAIWMRENPGDPDGDIVLLFASRSDATDPDINYCPNPRANPGCPAKIWRTVVRRGEWNRFVIQLQPSLDPGAGRIAVWHQGPGLSGRVTASPPVADVAHAWGYRPRSAAEDEFDIRVGIYRRQNPRRLKVLFDDLRTGTTAAAVDP